MIKYLGFVVVWIGMLCVKIPVVLLGTVVVPFLYRYKDTDYDELPNWTRLWSNPEDWTGCHMSYKDSLPKWWIDREGPGFKSFYKYHAIRNPANGLRSIEFLDLDIDPKKVEFKTNIYLDHYEPWYMRALKYEAFPRTAWYWAWQGHQAGFKLVHIWNDERHFVMKFGWRVQPSDKTIPIDPNGVRHEDSGFATKLIPYRKG